MLQVLNQSRSPKPDPPSLFPSRLASAGAHVQSVPGLHPGHILWILPQSLHQYGPSWNEWEVTDELIHAHNPSQTQPHWHAGGRRNCWVRASPLTFQKDTTSETNVSLWVLGLEGDSALRIYLYVRTFPAMANWDSYPLRSCRSSSKFNLPPPCRRLSEMSSTVFFFSLSLIKALW